MTPGKGEKWWKLPADHPRRLYFEFHQARVALTRAKGSADDNDWSRSASWYAARANELAKAQRAYDEKRAAWEAGQSSKRLVVKS